MSTTTISEANQLIELANTLGANVSREDESIAFLLTCRTNEELRSRAFGRLHAKYYVIARSFLDGRYIELSATAKDLITDMTFDRIWKYSTTKPIRTKNGSLDKFVTLLCLWEATKVSRTETRRRLLLTERFAELWCVQRDATEEFKGDAISEQDALDLIKALRRELDPVWHPNTARVMQAACAVYVSTGGLQVEGRPRNPSIAAIKEYLDSHGVKMSEGEIKSSLETLRAVARRVLRENGWEIDYLVSKYA